MSTLTIIGGGAGDPVYLTGEAIAAIQKARRIYAPPRLAVGLAALNPGIRGAGYADILAALEERDGDATVIVSGDAGFYSLADTLTKRLAGRYELRRITGVSSLQLLCARAGIGYERIRAVSTHGRNTSVIGAVAYNERVFVLTGGGADAAHILARLREAGLGGVTVWSGEALGSAAERVRRQTAAEWTDAAFTEPVVLLIEHAGAVSRHARLRDADFVRGAVPMTKEPVRTLSAERLEVGAADIVYDIGAGTGSVSVALARRACDGVVYAVERNPEALELLAENRRRLGAYNIEIVAGTAPDALAALPAPTKAFIGGSGGNLADIVAALQKKAGRLTVCINAVTLESIGSAISCLENSGFTDIEIDCVNVAQARATGAYHMMNALNPVTIISGRWA